MTEQQPPFGNRPTSQRVADTQRAVSQANSALSDMNSSIAILRTEADKAGSLFGFGRRILVPPDEIHVVVGDGRLPWTSSSGRKVFGQTANRPSRYWLNKYTQVIKLKTISFTVAIHGYSQEGVQALDSSKVSFRLWAHAVAKLNPDKTEIAAQRVGLDTSGLIKTITEVGQAELIAAAAQMSLDDIIKNRQNVANKATPQVNEILAELGYDLALLTITRIDGVAYKKLIEQSEARISKETGIATNKEQLAELDDRQARERLEAEIRADTEKKLASERLDAQREVETATISQQESLDIRRHEMELKQVGRQKSAAEAAHEADMAKVELAQQLGEAEARKSAHLAQIEAERNAELRAMKNQREAEIQLAQTQAEAARMAVAQAKEIERKAALTEAEAERLRREELARAERAKQIALVETSQIGESMEMEASAEANALQIKVNAETKSLQVKVDAETKMELVKAEAEATATEKRAQAAKIRAEATKAETAATGLAEVEVEAARVEVAEKRVAVTRAEGLAEAEVAQAQAVASAEKMKRLKEVEINAQKQLAKLYEEAPVLVELEKLRLQLTHEEKIATIQAETSLKAFEAIAPGIKVQIFGNGGQTGQILSNVMALSQGLNQIGEEVPLVGNLLNQVNGHSTENGQINAAMMVPQLRPFVPYLKQLLGEVNPRVLSSLKVSDVVERLNALVAGQEDLVTSLSTLKEGASFRVIGDMPISPILNLLGLNNDTDIDDSEAVTNIPVQDAE